MSTSVAGEVSGLDRYRSDYLAGGYRQDSIELVSIEVGGGWALGRYHVQQGFMPGDGQFHLTVPLAFVAFAQLAIVYAHTDKGYPEKKSEIFLREISLRCRKPVHETDIAIELYVDAKREVDNGTYYRGRIDVQHRAFTGVGAFLLPTQ
ncbi:hypothetical protein [Streptomyces sp. NPDC055287]